MSKHPRSADEMGSYQSDMAYLVKRKPKSHKQNNVCKHMVRLPLVSQAISLQEIRQMGHEKAENSS